MKSKCKKNAAALQVATAVFLSFKNMSSSRRSGHSLCVKILRSIKLTGFH